MRPYGKSLGIAVLASHLGPCLVLVDTPTPSTWQNLGELQHPFEDPSADDMLLTKRWIQVNRARKARQLPLSWPNLVDILIVANTMFIHCLAHYNIRTIWTHIPGPIIRIHLKQASKFLCVRAFMRNLGWSRTHSLMVRQMRPHKERF